MGRVQAPLAGAHRHGAGLPARLAARRHRGGGRLNILAYADRISLRAGESIALKVSCEGIERYDAELVRVVQGDVNPEGPGYREERVALDLGGPFEGRHQALRTGSYARVDDRAALAALESFCVTVTAWPTLPGRGCHSLLSRREADGGAGFELLLDERGGACFELHGRHGTTRVSTRRPLLARRWYALRAGYDVGSGQVSLSQTPLAGHSADGDAGYASGTAPVGISQRGVAAPLTIAARLDAGGVARRCYNGRLEDPRLFGVPPDEIGRDGSTAHGIDLGSDARCVAAWNFALEIPSERIVDVGGNGLHGRLFNLPTRGVTGSDWDGTEFDWRRAPEHYRAIHFHDDDLYDAGWQTDFIVPLPLSLPSAVYAVRLHAGASEFYVPFCVRPAETATTSDVAFLMPSASYMAYANNRIGIDVSETELVCGRLLQMNAHDAFLQEHPELGLSFYDLHEDGSGVFYSSRLRPILDMQPKFIGKLGGRGSNLWQFNADTHLTGWLEHIAQPFDVLADEDLHHEGVAAIGDYRVIVTGTHPEYHSRAMLEALEAYTRAGGRLMYLGGNGFYWRVSYHPELPGVLECRKSENGIRAFPPGPGEYYASFTGEYTGLWRSNGRAPNALVGVGMAAQGFDVSAPYRRSAASHDPELAFVFDGADEEVFGDYGLSGGGAAGLELDSADLALGTPPHARVLASSERHTDLYLVTPEDMLDPVPGLGGTEAEGIRSDVVLFDVDGGGAVFSVGSIAWAGSMAWNGYDNGVARMTANVLRRFLEEAPLSLTRSGRDGA